MLKALIKKQLLEFFSGISLKNKNEGKKSGMQKPLAVILLAVAFLSFFFMFFSMAYMLSPVIENGYAWLYFSIFGILSVLMGVSGSVFLTYNTVYEAKDNDLLLSMPIPPAMILFARITGLYVTALCFEALVFIPAVVVFQMVAGLSVFSLIFGILSLFVLPFFALSISSILGWVIALFSSRLRNKSIISVIFSVVFFALYYYAATKLNTIINMIIYYAEETGEIIRKFLYPFYCLGKGIDGDAVSYLAFFFITAVLFLAIYKLIARSFLKLATAERGRKKIIYKEKRAKQRSSVAAVYKKELLLLKNTPVYMLNSALGSLLLIIFAVFFTVKQNDFMFILEEAGLSSQGAPLLLCMAICFIASTNNMSSASVSLEGKNLWILRTAPCRTENILMGKLLLHLSVTGIPLIIADAIVLICLKTDFVTAAGFIIFTLLFTLMCAETGLVANLLFPKLEWINEAVPIKQSLPALIGMVAGLLFTIAFIVIFMTLMPVVSVFVLLFSGDILLVLVACIMWIWLRRKGTERFNCL
ncbi:MAG: hypothetical protein IJO68_02365 [Clostridia bacterium]|nr:hypothetical protein [Clostridia bacterium]